MVGRFVHSGCIMKSALFYLLVLLTAFANAFAQDDRDVAEWEELSRVIASGDNEASATR